jgi:hypothetical protein
MGSVTDAPCQFGPCEDKLGAGRGRRSMAGYPLLIMAVGRSGRCRKKTGSGPILAKKRRKRCQNSGHWYERTYGKKRSKMAVRELLSAQANFGGRFNLRYCGFSLCVWFCYLALFTTTLKFTANRCQNWFQSHPQPSPARRVYSEKDSHAASRESTAMGTPTPPPSEMVIAGETCRE